MYRYEQQLFYKSMVHNVFRRNTAQNISKMQTKNQIGGNLFQFNFQTVPSSSRPQSKCLSAKSENDEDWEWVWEDDEVTCWELLKCGH